MPLLNEIARITGGRIFMKDSISYAEYSRQKKDAEGDLKEAQKNGDSKEISRLETLLKEIDADYNTKDSVLSDLVGLAKKAGEALMEPTEKAISGDTKDADTEWFLEHEDTGKKVKGPFATEQEAISAHRSLRGSYKDWEKLFVTEERKAKSAAGDTKDAKEDDKPFEAYGVKGMKSTQWRKSFKNQKDFEKWLEVNEGDVEVQGYRDLYTKDADIIKYKGYSIIKIYPSKQFEVTHDGSLITREDTLEEAKSAIDKRIIIIRFLHSQ